MDDAVVDADVVAFTPYGVVACSTEAVGNDDESVLTAVTVDGAAAAATAAATVARGLKDEAVDIILFAAALGLKAILIFVLPDVPGWLEPSFTSLGALLETLTF